MLEHQVSAGQINSENVRRELRAMVDSVREAGAEYDDHFIDRFVQKLSSDDRLQLLNPAQMKQRARSVSGGQRLALAIVSVLVLMPLYAIVMGPSIPDAGMTTLFVFSALRIVTISLASFAIVAINIAFSR